MKRFLLAATLILVFSLAAGLLLGGCAEEDTAAVKVVTSTSLIAQIIERVGGDTISVVNIIPPAQCPGHYDVKPGDIQTLSGARLFIIHNWQGEKFSEDLIASANNPDLTVVKIEMEGNWMTPPVQTEAAGKIMESLAAIDPDNRAAYEEAAAEYQAIVAAKAAEIAARLETAGLGSINVLCDQQQTGFVKWAGLNVIATYGRPETFTPEVVKELVDQGMAGQVTLVIDNMQTGGESGAALAEELGAAHIVLSNFPGGYDDTDTWEEAIDKNIELILQVVGGG